MFGSKTTQISINVYNLLQDGVKFNLPGMGIYHTGVVVNGTEYAFGGGEGSGTGVWDQTPKECPSNCTFKENIKIGECKKSQREIDQILDQMKNEYKASKYDVASNNCNVFSNDACQRLCGKSIPSWINRPASLLSMFSGGKKDDAPSIQTPTSSFDIAVQKEKKKEKKENEKEKKKEQDKQKENMDKFRNRWANYDTNQSAGSDNVKK
ncbi:MAG: hypothetical protein EZS28_020665 [Streblomastix strix]|uniref:PPPDE domain-containing protein n=1 Tax=Streblomastix strix TaxID=222440 RepID=A0A5J4VMI2_9EUKA|nr:MAG: hypothetical protein EZS28_020665 [Streblomastix strix]